MAGNNNQNQDVLKTIKTSCPFPVLVYKVKIRYNEVEKASGIADILLELISNNVDSKETIANVLLHFGIPADLHHIFAGEMTHLISLGLVASRYASWAFDNAAMFSNMVMDAFTLTDKGRVMFRDKAIPTGDEKQKVVSVSYSPVKRNFSAGQTSKLLFSNTALSEAPGFQESISIDISGMGDFVEKNKTSFGIRKEEKIIGMEAGAPQWMAEKAEENFTITIRKDGATFGFNTTDETAFFNKYYSPGLAGKILQAKNNYTFPEKPDADMKLSDINPDNLYIPADYGKQASRPAQVYLGTGKYGVNREDKTIQPPAADAARMLNEMDNNASFALMDRAGCKYYCACNVEMPCPQFGGEAFEMQLLAENKLPEDKLRSALDNLYSIYAQGDITDESCKIMAYIADVTNDSSVLERYADAKFASAGSADDKILLLMEKLDPGMKAGAKNYALWKSVFEAIGRQLYNESAGETQSGNLEYKRTILNPLREALGIPDNQFLSELAAGIVNGMEPLDAYDALENGGFSDTEILSEINIVKPFMTMVLLDDDISSLGSMARKFNNLRASMWSLNSMLGIDSNTGIIVGDDYDTEEYLKVYDNFNTAYNAVKGYRMFAQEEYRETDEYNKIYTPIKEFIAMEKAANANPAKINKTYIDGLIRKSNYREAVCDLLIRLTLDLVDKLGANPKSKAADLIVEANNAGYFTPEENGALHELRNLRNDYQHPERTSTIEVTRAKLENWEKIVFSIPGRNPGKDNKGKDNKQ